MNPPPPPPPPHGNGTGNRGSGLPPGNYDIFIIPPHSSGSGFLYLPSLQPHRNSFLAGVGCTMLAMGIWTVVFPVLREWFATIVASGGVAVVILLIGVGVAGWAWGKTQTETTRPAEGGAGGASSAHTETPPNGSAYAGSTTASGPAPQYTPGPEPRAPPKPTWQRANTGPANPSANASANTNTNINTNGSANTGTAKGGWEKAREETRKKEEVRKRAEELRKKREDDEKERIRQREKDARERELRELREAREKREREAKEKKEKEVKEKKENEAKEKRENEAKEKVRATPPPPPPPPPSQPPPQPQPSPRKTEPSRPASPMKRHQPPTAQTATEDDAYSFRPYDKPKRPAPKTTSASSIYSESSYAPSQSTSRTTPPPSHRGPYHSKDPDKIVLKAVYSFNNTFTKLPIAQLVSGVGSVTDGLILRITTEGLFIDDDVRGVPQREWDVKAWTLKLVEVWCPHLHALGASSGSTPASHRTGIFGKNSATTKAPTGEESDRFVDGLTRVCKPAYPADYSPSKHGSFSSRYSSNESASSQSGEHKGLHVLRASIRDQDGKRYVFVLQQEEGWKGRWGCRG